MEYNERTVWTARQCAHYHGMTISGWWARVQKGKAPQPVQRTGRDFLWDAEETRTFQTGMTRRAQSMTAQKRSLLPPQPGEWTTQQCADHLGVAVPAWRKRVSEGTAPKPVRRTGHIALWDEQTVRAAKLRQQPGEWSAQQCADHHGIKNGAWRQRVYKGYAPKPVRRIGNIALWDEQQVRQDAAGRNTLP